MFSLYDMKNKRPFCNAFTGEKDKCFNLCTCIMDFWSVDDNPQPTTIPLLVHIDRSISYNCGTVDIKSMAINVYV